MPEAYVNSVAYKYDRVVEEYAEHCYHELAKKPVDQTMLARFADAVRNRGRVCDLGTGPGQVARFLADRGIPVFGLDVSVGMIKKARQLNPDLSFVVGDMRGLDILDNDLAGITAFYSIVNLEEEDLAKVFSEMARVLRNDGVLLLAFHIGNGMVQADTLWNVTVSLSFFFFSKELVLAKLVRAGFQVVDYVERQPYIDVEYQSIRGYVLARKIDLA